MVFTNEHLNELNLLTRFPSESHQSGIKVHRHEAPPETVKAAESLYWKGLTTQADGGYLTSLGSEAVEQAHKLLNILSSEQVN